MTVRRRNLALMKLTLTAMTARYSTSLMTSIDCMPGTHCPMMRGSSRCSQTRWTGASTWRVFSISMHFLRRNHHRFNDLRITGAAAQIAIQPFLYLFDRGLRMLFQNRAGRDDHARRAIPALQAATFHERLL